jgi:hypothetical protein
MRSKADIRRPLRIYGLLRFDRLRPPHPRLPVKVFMIAASVPEFLVNKVVVQGVHKSRFAVTIQPSRFEVFDCATVLARSTFRHIFYPLFERREGGRLSGAESSLKSSSRHSRAKAIVAASAIETSGRFLGLPNLSK